MKILSLILLVILAAVDPATVKKINASKSAAEKAFQKGDYPTAIRHYQYLVDSLGVTEDEVLLNLGNAHYLAKDTASALHRYQTVSNSPKPVIRSKALQQLGNLANQQGRAEEALNLFKQAIKAAPANDDARYNYEMLKKKLDEQKEQEEQQQQDNQDQQNQDQQKQDEQKQDQQQDNQDQQDSDQEDQQSDQQKEQEQKEQEQREQEQQQDKEQQEQQDSDREDMPNLDRDKLKEMKISEEQARMILEAMKNQEKQYLQQQKRKPTESRDSNKPDW